jgi:ribosome biogenesis GTPase A
LIYYFPDELKSKVDTQQQLNDIIESKYKLIKKHDNFASFNKLFTECYQTAENLIHKNHHNPNFKKFYKTESKKLTPVRFNPCKSLINPLYSDDVVGDLEKFSKEIHLRPQHSLKL